MSQITRLIPKTGPGSGTVTSISAGTGITLTPNPITTTGTVSLTIPVSIADGGTNATSFTNTDGVVYFDGTRLVDTTVGTLGQVLTSQGAGLPPQFEAVPASSITITGDSGSSTGNNFEFTGNTTGLTFTSGSDIIDLGGTLIVSNGGTGATTLTTHGVLLGNGTSAITATTAGTTGQVLTGVTGGAPTFQSPAASSITITGDSGGGLTGNSFTFTGSSTGLTFAGAGSTETLGGTLVVAHGGTGQTTFTANELIASGSTATGAFQQITNGTAGQVLTANASGLPTFQNAASSGITTIDGDTGSVTGTTVSFIAQLHAGQTVKFSGSGTTMDLLVTDTNGNTTIGSSAGAGGQSGSSNTSVGSGSLGLLSSGSNNTAAGTGASTAITTGSFNTSLGYGSLNSLKTGNYNIALGQQAGNAYTGSETANILIGNTGTVGESNVIRIGTQGSTGAEQNACYIAGIAGTTVSNINAVTINTATGQLGSEAFPSSSITITGDSGGGLSGNSFTFTGGSTGLTFAGSGTTETLGGTVSVSHGGTGDTSFTAYAPIAGGTTTTGALQSISSGISNSGYVLTSTGASSLPTWQAASSGGITTIDGNTGSVTGSTVTIEGTYTSCGTPNFSGSGTTLTFNAQDNTSNQNIILTAQTTTAVTGAGNNFHGTAAGINSAGITGSENNFFGYFPAYSLTSGSHNAAFGQQPLLFLTTGSYNTCIAAYQGGVNYTSSESNNISIAASSTTVAGESNVLRIGDGTGTGTQQVNKAFISGIYGTTSTGNPVLVNSSNQLTAGGISTNTHQPAFSAYVTVQQSNVTGDGTVYQVIFDTSSVNNGTNYNTTTGVFTAPVTGTYFFTATIQLAGIGAQTNGYIQLVATGHSYNSNTINPSVTQVSGYLSMQVSAIIAMNSGDTCAVKVVLLGSTKTVTIGGSNGFFGGYLIC